METNISKGEKRGSVWCNGVFGKGNERQMARTGNERATEVIKRKKGEREEAVETMAGEKRAGRIDVQLGIKGQKT